MCGPSRLRPKISMGCGNGSRSVSSDRKRSSTALVCGRPKAIARHLGIDMPTTRKVSTSQSVPEFTKVPTGDVLFDPQNPRLGADTTASQPRLQALLMEEPHFAKELVGSFVENEFIE